MEIQQKFKPDCDFMNLRALFNFIKVGNRDDFDNAATIALRLNYFNI